MAVCAIGYARVYIAKTEVKYKIYAVVVGRNAIIDMAVQDMANR